MPRELSEKDIRILQKLAPECGDLTCSGSGHMFHSILPPVSNHFASDVADFRQRIGRLSDEELSYLVTVIEEGGESLGCMPVEDIESLVNLVSERLSPEAAGRVVAVYESVDGCSSGPWT